MTDTQPSDALTFRYRVSGMDCAKDAAQIERAAQAAGIAPNAVKVSAATHIMTLNIPEVRLPEIEKAVATTGYEFDRIEGDGDAQAGAAHQDPSYRRALWTVVLLNVGYGVIEMVGGFLAGSQAVKADALDFIGDGLITLLGLLAIGWTVAWRARSALIQGIFLGILSLIVLATTLWRIFTQTMPDATLMGVFGIVALAVNVLAVLPLMRFRKGDANMRAVWLFSRNDAIGNAAVVVAAGLVAWLGSAWPDLIVAFGIAGLFMHSSWSIIRDAQADLRGGR
ncbi:MULTISPECIES: cation transporter [unclassified Ruegeria]|uniref:cation transporter n=1 Tax=unclassified Ruegeria TaxID=2625375 RepID=UPI001490B7C3|nr:MULTISPECIES: cation transporter [unclassified Ruegeria]NOD47232.1 cation transporter [Ruegeria sp. HKCCD5849]NOD51555.1 cation transporter [Ruegeria sp. HKCCD5851]NOD69300.1 cation transporter [Ruegeria sp. HKCCD7303]